MTEAELLAEVTALCDRLGLLWFHLADPRYGQGSKGFPDLVIVGTRGVIFRELKSEDGVTSPEQDNWGWHLVRSHDLIHRRYERWGIWRPSLLKIGLIGWELGSIR